MTIFRSILFLALHTNDNKDSYNNKFHYLHQNSSPRFLNNANLFMFKHNDDKNNISNNNNNHNNINNNNNDYINNKNNDDYNVKNIINNCS